MAKRSVHDKAAGKMYTSLFKLYKTFPKIYTRIYVLDKALFKKGVLLDAGCGSGDLLAELPKLRPEISRHGTDIVRNKNLQSSIHFFESDLNKRINAKDASYDMVISTHTFEHLSDTRRTMQEIYRVLKPGGRLYIEVPSERSKILPSFSFINPNNQAPISFFDDPTHIRPYTPCALARLCNDSGFKVYKAGYSRNWLFAIASPILFISGLILGSRDFIGHGLRHVVGWSSYVVAEKPK